MTFKSDDEKVITHKATKFEIKRQTKSSKSALAPRSNTNPFIRGEKTKFGTECMHNHN